MIFQCFFIYSLFSCPLKCSGFVPQTNLLYAAGRDKTIRIFNIDRKNNPKLASIYFKDAPIRFATAVPSTIRSGPSVYFLTHKKTLGYLDVESKYEMDTRVFPLSFNSAFCVQ